MPLPSFEERQAVMNARYTAGTFGGRLRAPSPRPVARTTGQRPTPPSSGLRPATVVVAPSNCSDKSRADVVLTGTNDHTDILLALAGLSNGGRLLILEGDVYFAGLANSFGPGLLVEGMGAGTVVHLTTTGSRLALGGTGGTVRDLLFSAEAPGTSAECLYMSGDYGEAENVIVQNNGAGDQVWGIRQDGLGSRVRACSLLGCSLGVIAVGVKALVEGCYVTGAVNGIQAGQAGRIIGNVVSGATIGSTAPVSGIATGLWCLVEANWVDLFTIGIHCTGTGTVVIDGNRVENCRREGIMVDGGDDLAVVNNLCIGNGTDANNTWANICIGPHVAVANQVNQVMVAGNMCRKGANVNKPRYGLFIEQSATNTYDSGNDLYQSGVTASRQDNGVGTVVGAADRL